MNRILWLFKPKNSKAFTLLEQSLVIAVLAIMAATGSMYFSKTSHKQKYEETNRRINVINDAILAYYLKKTSGTTITNDMFPCPASPTLSQDDIDYGLVTNSGLTCNLPSKNNGYSYGVIPVRSLGLPYYYGYDAWGNRLSYVVKYDNVADVLVDWTDAALAEKLYMIISHGENGNSAFTKSGAQRKASNDDNEIKNSINSTNYSEIASYQNSATYDDVIHTITGSRFMLNLSGGVIPSQTFCTIMREKTYNDDACKTLRNKILTLCPKQ